METKKKPLKKYKNVEVFKVDIVNRAATEQRFLKIRSKDGSSTLVSIPTSRQVPEQDADNEAKREAQKKRSEKYGIEVLEGKGENLSYPAGDPTTEELYGDPVNLKYPLGRENNEVDPDRASNARARFKQNYGTYTSDASLKVIHTRIVEAELKGGVTPDYDPDDNLDKMLPRELKEKLEQPVERNDAGRQEDNKHTQTERAKMQELDEKIQALVAQVKTISERMDNLTPNNGEQDSKPVGEVQSKDGNLTPPQTLTQQDTTTPPGQQVPVAQDSTPVLTQAAPAAPAAPVAPAAPAVTQPTSQSACGCTCGTCGQAIAERAAPNSNATDAKLVEVLNSVATGFGTLSASVVKLTERVATVERSYRSGGNASQPESDGPQATPVGKNNGDVFGNLFAGIGGYR